MRKKKPNIIRLDSKTIVYSYKSEEEVRRIFEENRSNNHVRNNMIFDYFDHKITC